MDADVRMDERFAPTSLGSAADFPQLLEDFDAHLELKGRAERTRASYRYNLTRFWCDYAFRSGGMLGQDAIAIGRYLRTIPAQGHSRTDRIRALKAFYAWATAQGWYITDPTADLTIPKPANRAAPDIPEEQVRRLLRAAFRTPRYEGRRRYGFDRRRGWAILLDLETGARLGSLVNVRPEDVHLDDPNGPWIYFRVAKGNRPYELALTRAAVIACRHLLQSSNTSGSLIGVKGAAFRRWIQHAAFTAGLDVRVYPHLLRHHFSHRLAEKAVKKGKLAVWQRGMNHADLSQFGRYNHVERSEMAEVMEG